MDPLATLVTSPNTAGLPVDLVVGVGDGTATLAGTLYRISFALALCAACSSSSSAKKPDAKSTVDAFFSTCGEPGDMGNELGIGKFCTGFGDCAMTPAAPLCSIAGDSTTFFCTKTCTSGGPADQCGTATSCTCNTNTPPQCGCTPNSCLM